MARLGWAGGGAGCWGSGWEVPAAAPVISLFPQGKGGQKARPPHSVPLPLGKGISLSLSKRAPPLLLQSPENPSLLWGFPTTPPSSPSRSPDPSPQQNVNWSSPTSSAHSTFTAKVLEEVTSRHSSPDSHSGPNSPETWHLAMKEQNHPAPKPSSALDIGPHSPLWSRGSPVSLYRFPPFFLHPPLHPPSL